MTAATSPCHHWPPPPRITARQQAGHQTYWDSYSDDEQVFYGHVLGFEGLERAAVVLAVNGFGTDGTRAREKLYGGLSRARDRLTVCADPDLITRIAGDPVLRRLRAI